MNAPSLGYESVIGLEVHVQLATRTKIFCACPTAFGAAPNSQVCPVCLGHPGVMPVLNAVAVDAALRFGLAVGATIPPESVFARKNYFYPDLPKGYQITQFDRPILRGGRVRFRVDGDAASVRLTRAHLEEDAGKLTHACPEGKPVSLVDLNRAGVPLLEIVTEPDLRSAREAHAFLVAVRRLVRYLRISDGNMEEGSLRCDANISVRPRGRTAMNPKTEIKNLNSFRHVERALEWERDRQTAVLEDGGTLRQATRLWDESAGHTRVMRTKEEAEDYRYFPEPDLGPLRIDPARLEPIREALPELPWDREARFRDVLGLGAEDAALLAGSRRLADYFETVSELAGDPRAAANWVMTEVLRRVKAGGWNGFHAGAESLGRLLRMTASGMISAGTAKRVAGILAAEGGDPEAIVRRRGWLRIADPDVLAEEARRVLEEHPGPAAQARGGKTTVKQFLIGQIMRRTGGRADPNAAARAVDAALSAREEDTP